MTSIVYSISILCYVLHVLQGTTLSTDTSTSIITINLPLLCSNFMIRDSRMRSMIANEPITPYIYRVNALHKEKGTHQNSCILSQTFFVHDHRIVTENYASVTTATKRIFIDIFRSIT